MSLWFQADLSISGAGSDVTVSDDGAGGLVITVDELRPLVAALRSDAGLPSGMLRTVPKLLADTGGTVHLRTPSRDLVTLGAGAVPTLVTRTVGLPHVRIRSLRGLLVALRPPLTPAVPAVVAGGLVLALSLALRRRFIRGTATISGPGLP